MSDIKTLFIDMSRGIDYVLQSSLLENDNGLDTAVILSLFTDARAHDDDALPVGQTDRRGWWADAYADDSGDRFGSRLWLLRAKKQLPQSLVEARDIAREALAWMVEDGVAQRVEVETFNARFEVMGMIIRIYKPGDLTPVSVRLDLLWSSSQ